jgi:acetate kinase
MTPSNILAVNAGSSSVKFAVFDSFDPAKKILSGSVEPASAASGIIAKLSENSLGETISAVGHRIVNGGAKYSVSALLDEEVLASLHGQEPFDPDHLPEELKLIEEFRAQFRGVPQVACFDTDFYRDLPRVARIVPIPRRYEAKGVRRHGFHGLSYSYLMKELARTQGEEAGKGRVILAHLGSGASLTAVLGGKPVDTTMGFTPQSGVPMSSRSGDIDPGLAWYLARTEGMSVEQFNRMISTESGLLGVSETSADMHALLDAAPSDVRAEEAVALFCYEVKKRIGAFAAALGGLDTLIFAGGIGEKAPRVRSRVCKGLEFLGVELDANKNAANESSLATSASKVAVLAMYTDEESVIAEETRRILQLHA